MKPFPSADELKPFLYYPDEELLSRSPRQALSPFGNLDRVIESMQGDERLKGWAEHFNMHGAIMASAPDIYHYAAQQPPGTLFEKVQSGFKRGMVTSTEVTEAPSSPNCGRIIHYAYSTMRPPLTSAAQVPPCLFVGNIFLRGKIRLSKVLEEIPEGPRFVQEILGTTDGEAQILATLGFLFKCPGEDVTIYWGYFNGENEVTLGFPLEGKEGMTRLAHIEIGGIGRYAATIWPEKAP